MHPANRGDGSEAPPSGFPWQVVVRVLAAVVGLTLLLVVEVRGVTFYLAWSLIVLAVASEAVATGVFWHRARRG